MVFRFLIERVVFAVVVILATRLSAQVEINEIHYDPPEKTEPHEFVELHNPTSAPVSVAGWRLSGGVEYPFPANARIEPDGYLVVAQDPEAFKDRFGVEALGPWTGRLRNVDERVDLLDAGGHLVDRVDYRLGFPWPTVGEPPGLSIELIHPGLDNELGGHWRASLAGGGSPASRETVVDAGATWRFWRGLSEPSAPLSAWRTTGFDDGSWDQGPLPIGYDPSLSLGTRLDDMRGNYTSVYFRRHFSVANPASVSALEVSALYDDGFRVWINGRLVLEANLAAGELPFDAVAGPARESNAYETFEVSVSPGLLESGDNVVAVQAHNSSLNGSSDFFFDARFTAVLGPTGRGPTPGRVNAVYATNAPPAIRQVEHAPAEPRGGQSVTITAKVSDGDGVSAVTLNYQVIDPGAYIELTDPEYETAWNTVPMRDDGLGADATAEDGIFTAMLAGDVQHHRRLVRYRILAMDRLGAAVRVPYPDDPEPNFAYFVYDAVPAWTGAIRPGATTELGEPFTVAAEEMNRLPVIHLLAKRSAIEDATWFSRYGGDAYLWRGTLAFRGKVYDHIRYRTRGGVWRYAMVKNMWKFDFNRGHDFEPCDNWRRASSVGWNKLNLGASIQQGDYNHRGEQGMFESVGFRVFQLAGVPAMNSTFVQFRIIDDAAETVEGDQYDGDFWGLYLMLEQPDGRFLDAHGLPDGNLYKMEGGGGELNNLGPAGPADGSDLRALLNDYNGATEAWWRARVDVPNYLSYQTVVQAIHHYDICYDKNFFYYLHPSTGRWQVVPWDLDLTWAENMFDAGCGGVDRFKERMLTGSARFPGIWRQWQNRIREFRDLFWNDDEAARLIDEMAGRLRGPAVGPTILDADRAQWDYNPRMADNRYSSAPSKAGLGRFYRWPSHPASEASRDFEGCVRLMKSYIGYRATNTQARARALDLLAADPAIPERPQIRYVGGAGYPANALRLQCSDYRGGAAFAALRWRLGEITPAIAPSWAAAEPWNYEIESVWDSGPIAAFASELTLPSAAVRTGRVYRARAQFQDVEGRISRWSEPVQFVAGAAENATELAGSLRITELMYNSADGAANDFVELHNAGTGVLNLGGAEFAEGITYTFPVGATLAPGGYLLVVRASAANNFAAFRALYGIGASVPIFGPYNGNLNDGGERLALRSPGGGAEILAITYSDGRGWPVAADGAGHSIVPRQDFGAESSGALDYGPNWRASAWIRGSPGQADPEPDSTVVLNEVVAHTDFLSEFDSNDWVEIYHRGEAPFLFGAGWYLSDDGNDLQKWPIPPQTRIAAHGWVTFDEITGFNNPRGSGFSLDKAGEQVFLSYFPAGTRGRVVDAVSFKGQENEWALARYPDGGDFWDQVIPRTKGTANAAPPPRVAISEILYHETGLPTNALSADQLEFIELYNPTAQRIALYNTNAVWRLNGAVEFDLPLFTSIEAGERMVIVSFDPILSPASLAGFRATFQMPSSIRVIGPYAGRLDNDQDRLALERAQAPEKAGDPITWVIVDEVDYFDDEPWPSGADGQGRSLNRRELRQPGNNPANWFAASPTPGAAPGESPSDSDNDGMPDAWESAHGLNPSDPADAAQDPDQDGLANRDEYLAGTDPQSAASSLRLHDPRLTGGGNLEFSFIAAADRAYVVERSDSGLPGSWQEFQTIPAEAESHTVTVQIGISSNGTTGFHRVRLQ